MANTYVAIATVTVGVGGASYIEFTSIPSTYTDLIVKASLRNNRNDAPVTDTKISFNGAPSGTSYSYRGVSKDASNGLFSGSGTSTSFMWGLYENGDTATSNAFSTFEMYIPNYTSSNYKTASVEAGSEQNNIDQYLGFSANLWSDSSSITSIRLTPYYGTLSYKQYSTATLYGIKKN